MNLFLKIDGFALLGNELIYLVGLTVASTNLIDPETLDTLKHFSNVLDDWSGILRLTDDLKKILIGEEVESWELSSFGIQELIQVLLDIFELPVQLVKCIEEALDNQTSEAISFFVDSIHFSPSQTNIRLEHSVVSLEIS